MNNISTTAQKLMDTFCQFSRLHWNQSPVVGLKPSEVFVLYCIKQNVTEDAPGIKISEISSILKVTSPTVTQLINTLEANGFVERSTDQSDRRAVRIKLTEKGEAVLRKASESFTSSFNGLVEYLGDEKSNELAELMTKVLTYFSEIKKESI